MIIKARKYHKEEMTELWCNAFGDKKENVNKYIDTLFKYFLVYEEDGKIKGMLSVLPVSLEDKKGGYIYAVVTHPKFRKMGICNSMIESVKADKDYDFLVLVPQNKELFDFYGRMGFSEVSFLKKAEAEAIKDKQDKWLLKEISGKDYEKKRNEFYKNDRFIKWDATVLDFAKSMYNGAFYEIFNGKNSVGSAFLYKEKETVYIKELLSENCDDAAKKTAAVFGGKKVKYSFESEKGEPTFMVYPKSFDNTKFNIFLD